MNSADGKAICAKWRTSLARQVARYEWEIDPDDAKGPTIHGLRGTGVLARWSAGYGTDQIANDIGMTRQNVDRYAVQGPNAHGCGGFGTLKAAIGRGLDGQWEERYIERCRPFL